MLKLFMVMFILRCLSFCRIVSVVLWFFIMMVLVVLSMRSFVFRLFLCSASDIAFIMVVSWNCMFEMLIVICRCSLCSFYSCFWWQVFLRI